MRRIATLLLAGGLAFLVHAATLQRLELDEMTQKATGIVRGRVLASYARLHGSVIYTHYRVQVLERWKGAEAAEVDVVLPGGTANGLRQSFPGSPKLTEGSEYILFLWTGSSGLTNVMGLTQGIFDVQRGAGGEVIALRAATTETMLDAAGRLVRDEAVRMNLQELRGRVSVSLARGASR
jgi:hypothetical protein